METITILLTNLASRVRTEWMGGREYRVAPATLIVEGVLAGSKGPLFYPADEIARNVDAWNGMPIVLRHPIVDGKPASGRDPKVIDKWGMGYLFNTDIESKNKLAAEAWFDVENTKRISPVTWGKIDRGEPVELSTGLFTDNEPTVGVFNGKNYTHVARNYRPDHLAILPDQLGACSVKDGCGVLVNVEVQGIPVSEELDLSSLKPGSSFEKVLTSVGELWEVKEINLNSAVHPNQPKSLVTGYYKRLNAGTGKGPVHEAAQSGHLNVTDDHKKLGSDAATQIAGGAVYPTWAEEQAWNRAKAEAEKSGKGEDYPRIVAIYEGMGGKITHTTTNESTTHGDSDMDRKKVIQWLTTNCSCWKGQEKTLETMSDQALTSIENHEKEATENKRIANAAKAGIKVGNKQFVFNAAGEVETTALNAEMMKCPECDKSMEVGGTCGECGYEDTTDNSKKDGKGKGGTPPPGKGGTPKGETVKNVSMQDWLAMAPPEAQAVWNSAAEIERSERERICNALVAHIPNETAKKSAFAVYAKMSLKDLRPLAAAIPQRVNNGQGDNPNLVGDIQLRQPIPNYGGQGGDIANNVSDSDEDQSDTLQYPIINWDEELQRQGAKGGSPRKKASVS